MVARSWSIQDVPCRQTRWRCITSSTRTVSLARAAAVLEQMLRNLRRPEGLVHERGLPAHRAGPDTYVTAHHLRDMLNETSVEQLLA